MLIWTNSQIQITRVGDVKQIIKVILLCFQVTFLNNLKKEDTFNNYEEKKQCLWKPKYLI